MSEPTPTWMKVLGFFAVVALVGLLALVALGFWAKNMAEEALVDVQTSLPAIAEEGVRYAASHSATECVEEGRNRAVKCGSLELTCQMGASIFGKSCLDAAGPDADLCAGVPSSTDVLGIGPWANERCSAEGHAGSTSCSTYYQQVLVQHCALAAPAE